MLQDFPAPRGKRKPSYIKYLMGIPIIIIIVVILFGPLLAYSLVNHIGTRNLPEVAHISVELEGFPVSTSVCHYDDHVACSASIKWSHVPIWARSVRHSWTRCDNDGPAMPCPGECIPSHTMHTT